MKKLVVVESPTKAKTISRFLPKDEYQIEACFGHVRDLPANAAEIPKEVKKEGWSRIGVNIDENFEPLYVVSSKKKKVVRDLKAAMKNADELYIATDEDREGESIGWHLLEILKPKIPVKRMVFHEITKSAIEEALEKTREVNVNLVEAQTARRVLDRLVGYMISPLLWRKVAPRLSAGRVQSAAVRLLVNREKERIKFVPASYWDLKSLLNKGGQDFEAVMTHLGETRLATGKDFDEDTGKLRPDAKVLQLDKDDVDKLADRFRNESWNVSSVEEKKQSRRPYPPFITSTLQQEANRKLGISARETMSVAQKLYEKGLITYMRTDSTNLSGEAITAARGSIVERYGEDYLPSEPRVYKNKSKNAQEAHEAIRPAGTTMATAKELGLEDREYKVYDLIWKRTVASQMEDAKLTMITARIKAGDDGTDQGTFRASGKRIDFPGFFRAYVEGSDDPEAALENQEKVLPELKEGQTGKTDGGKDFSVKEIESLGHETKPPARFTEASLVKELEALEIGRPSTYASIISTVINRGYVQKRGSQLIPTFTAFATNNVLEQKFEPLVNYEFTAEMEEKLDEIAAGKIESAPYLAELYHGPLGLKNRVETGMEEIDAREVSTLYFKEWEPYVVRVGKWGPYVQFGEDDDKITSSIPKDMAPDEVSTEYLGDLIEKQKEGNPDGDLMGVDPITSLPLLLKVGPYGPYIQVGPDDTKPKPKRTSLPKGMEIKDVTPEIAIGLASLPRTLGQHPETGDDIKASIGRFGPYVQQKRIFASLKTDDVLTVGLERALELLAEKLGKSGPIRELGTDPESGEDIGIYKGRYGPYIKFLKLNVSIPKDEDHEKIDLPRALELIAAKVASKGTKVKRKPAAKKKAAAKKKPAAKKKVAAKKKD